ncbi:MAG: glycosyltransferase family A protein [Rothia sp. (in: high G+C Gram-positive bacteria)]|nr:glycosyltransferase family A protein [Rothia sp. (in: high G+C Gram-positive bacteria)]
MEKTIKAVGIVIPAHNEVDEIDRCLAAVFSAIAHAQKTHPHLYFSLHCVTDACTDGTETVVKKHLRQKFPVHIDTVNFRNPAQTRNHGIQRFLAEPAVRDLNSDEIWLAMTDADTVVPTHWLTEQIALAKQGADAIIGTVEPRKSELGSDLYNAWLDLHNLSEGHTHVFGANLGIRATAYQRVGGFAPLAHSEDAALVTALEQAGFSLRKTDRVRAITSGRFQGKVDHGFSTYLQDLSLSSSSLNSLPPESLAPSQ